MNPIGGLSLLTHVVINTGYKVARTLSVDVRSVFIVAAILALTIWSTAFTLHTVWRSGNNVELVREAAHTCEPVSPPFGTPAGRVILRLDDVQAYAYRDITRRILSDAESYHARLVVGVIPSGITDDDVIESALSEHACNLELALHGWDHSSGSEGSFEFENAEEAAAVALLRKGKQVLAALAHRDPVTFIPPGNEVSEGTRKALGEEGFRYLSSDREDGEFGMDATTYDFPNKRLLEVTAVLHDCEKKFGQNKPCVVVMHPQDYLTDDAIDSDKYARFTELLATLRNSNIETVTFRNQE